MRATTPMLVVLILVGCRESFTGRGAATPPPPGAAPPLAPPPAPPSSPPAPPTPYVPPHGPPPTIPPVEDRPRFGTDHRADVAPPMAPYQSGEASYYHDSLAGRSTASGAPYDPRKMTAAHRKLPFGTIVDVVRNDGRWVRVTINDRGPYHGGRVIDLSRRAAEHLGLLKRGVAQVKLYVVARP